MSGCQPSNNAEFPREEGSARSCRRPGQGAFGASKRPASQRIMRTQNWA